MPGNTTQKKEACSPPRPYSRAVKKAYGWKLCNPESFPSSCYSRAAKKAYCLNQKGNEYGYYSIY